MTYLNDRIALTLVHWNIEITCHITTPGSRKALVDRILTDLADHYQFSFNPRVTCHSLNAAHCGYGGWPTLTDQSWCTKTQPHFHQRSPLDLYTGKSNKTSEHVFGVQSEFRLRPALNHYELGNSRFSLDPRCFKNKPLNSCKSAQHVLGVHAWGFDLFSPIRKSVI